MPPFHDLHSYVEIPRVSGLRLSPDGTRLVTVVSTYRPRAGGDGPRYVTSLWEVDPEGTAEPRRLTRSASGETGPEFLPDGGILFTSPRPDPDAGKADDETPALWLLPAGGGEARHVASRPGGVSAVAVARTAGTVAFTSPVMAGAMDAKDDEERRKAREDADVNALLHESYPIRYWDHDLGPAQLRLFAAAPPESGDGVLGEPRDLTPSAGRALDEQHFEVTPDGRTVVTGWYVFPGGAEVQRAELVALDAATGERRVLAADSTHEFYDPVVSPDGRHVVCVRERLSTYDEPLDRTLWLVDVDGTGGRDLVPDLDRWPTGPVWSQDGRYVYFVADDRGRRPVFRVDVGSGEVVRLTGDDGAYASLAPSPDGRFVYAMRDCVDEPPTPVRLDAAVPGQQPTRLRGPGVPVEVPGGLTEVEATADDGWELRGWLVLPEGASADAPAPLLLWIHGGPLGSWNGWHWRWNPWIMAAHGHAVLLPDPALSTGYGLDFVRRGWGAWGGRPYTDLMAITDAVVKRADIDETRTAAMGGSFGGYMANWVAGHTDRFRAIVTHASLWALDQMKTTTDLASYWRRELGDPDVRPERYVENSPHLHVGNIRTPMLVIHGDKDYRVPIGEALRLWWDLTRHEVDAKFLYFPDENHWVRKPGDVVVWYETVLAFLAHHVLGEEWSRPSLL